ncbi:MAG: aconitate hydratase AcnA [Thermoguttaceae bacterium]|jgi:aconitate hydratase|nr:aconitate hydratase AcnA [Thermoguttaceae bacterium]
MADPFSAREMFETGNGRAALYRLKRLEDAGLARIEELPYSIRVLLESVLRSCDGFQVTEADVKALAAWRADGLENTPVPFKPARVILQDFTGVPAIVDLAAMRDAMKRLGGDPKRINPLIPVDLVIDHSVQVDSYASPDSLAINTDLEFQRNRERYEFLRWGQKSFSNFSVLPPALGIVHQVNLEFLAKGVILRNDDLGPVAFPDTVVGTDSHTPMINGLGVLGWGVGGIEAEAVMLGEPLGMLAPEVVGVELLGELRPGATATDIVLAVTQMLRREGVVGKFVEYFGEAVATMGVADRALVANMSPEYGATAGFFPTDERTLDYLRLSGRDEAQVELVERYCKEQQLFRTPAAPPPRYSTRLQLDLSTVEPSLAGPKRPQDRVLLKDMKASFRRSLTAPHSERGFELAEGELGRTMEVAGMAEGGTRIGHGAVVIAAITSCTNTSNPEVMLAAGLLAKKAVERGLRVPPHVKTSLAPGSLVVTDYYAKTGLDKPLEALGFHTVGYGCTTCIGNSGPLPAPVAKAITEGKLVAASVLSGNRNFEGRINPMVKANYLAGPPLVVAYALAGTVDVDLLTEPIGQGSDGRDVFLRDLWPAPEEVRAVAAEAVDAEMFRRRYATVYEANPKWNAIEVAGSELFPWSDASTYIQEPPFLLDLPAEPSPISPILGARVLAILGDSVTTDHISPAGAIGADSPAGRYLQERGVEPKDFNSFGSRRGNDRVMTRGTFGNIRIRNQLAPGTEGGVTRHLPDGRQMSIFDAAMAYREEGVPLLVIAGEEYGSGSSRDWAAKGTQLLGVRAVIAQSYERIHRSNLVGMGVLPLRFGDGDSRQSLGLTGEETYDIPDLNDRLMPGQCLTVRATAPDGGVKEFSVRVCIDTPVELAYYRHGGILPYVLRKLA